MEFLSGYLCKQGMHKSSWVLFGGSFRFNFPIILTKLLELLSVIVKWGDDLRQEVLCSQLLMQFKVANIYNHCHCLLLLLLSSFLGSLGT
jgi:hypothetical protein